MMGISRVFPSALNLISLSSFDVILAVADRMLRVVDTLMPKKINKTTTPITHPKENIMRGTIKTAHRVKVIA